MIFFFFNFDLIVKFNLLQMHFANFWFLAPVATAAVAAPTTLLTPGLTTAIAAAPAAITTGLAAAPLGLNGIALNGIGAVKVL